MFAFVGRRNYLKNRNIMITRVRIMLFNKKGEVDKIDVCFCGF